MAEKSAKDGTLTDNERDMISNALTLDDIAISEIMTPHSVIYALDVDETIGTLFKANQELPFGRIPLFYKDLNTIVGIVRRRDLLSAKAKDQDTMKIRALAQSLFLLQKKRLLQKRSNYF